MHNAFLGVEPAQIEWRPAKSQPGSTDAPLVPYSTRFNDIYFDSRDGIAETDYVFLEGNRLRQRFEKLTADRFVIAETGFGTGLNFLRTCKLWQEVNPNAQLEFISIEQFPIAPAELARMYQALGIESETSRQLLQQLPPALPGVYPIHIDHNIKLTLLLFPLDKALKELALGDHCKIDAWFLDGFAPSKNPDMWSKGLLHFMALHAINDGTRRTSFATFTAASAVRKQLFHFGFEVRKVKGFGFKREMLVGDFSEKKISTPHPTLADDYLKLNQTAPAQTRVAVIGGGLAGCATASALHKRGIQVELFERGPTLASGASKIPALLAAPNTSIDHNAFSQLTFSGLYHLQHYVHRNPQLSYSDSCLQLESDKYSQWQLKQYVEVYQQRFWQDGQFKWHTTRINNQQHQGLLMPGVLVNGPAFCESLVSKLSPQQIHLSHAIQSLDELNDFDHIILATGHHRLLNQLASNEPAISPLRGQLTVLQQKPGQRLGLEYPINYDGHLFECQDQLMVGATFDASLDESANEQDRQRNLQQASQRFGLQLDSNKQHKDYVGIRAATYDRFPFCGPLNSDEGNRPLVWANYGFGTRGLCLSLVSAELIACAINHEPLPLPKTLLQRVSPKRTQKA